MSKFFNTLRLIYYVMPTSFPTALQNVRVNLLLRKLQDADKNLTLNLQIDFYVLRPA